MKIIDLLVKISKGEEVPNKILQHCECFDEDKEWQLTKRSPKCYEAVYKDWERDDSEFLFDYLTTDMLNDTLEIIEDKKIEKVDTDFYMTNDVAFFFANKINEIIDKLNKEE